MEGTIDDNITILVDQTSVLDLERFPYCDDVVLILQRIPGVPVVFILKDREDNVITNVKVLGEVKSQHSFLGIEYLNDCENSSDSGDISDID